MQPKCRAEPVVPPLFLALVVISTASVVGLEPPAGQNEARGSAILVIGSVRLGMKRRAKKRAHNLWACHHDLQLITRETANQIVALNTYLGATYLPDTNTGSHAGLQFACTCLKGVPHGLEIFAMVGQRGLLICSAARALPTPQPGDARDWRSCCSWNWP